MAKTNDENQGRITEIRNELRALANKEIAQHSQKFFKTAKGQYGEGDIFLGIRVPKLRAIAKKYSGISIDEVSVLLKSEFHEERLVSLFLLVGIFKKAKEPQIKKTIYSLYLDNTKFINNWDLVDCSAEHIVGAYLQQADRQPIYELARSQNLWERRIAIMSTFCYIKRDEFDDTIEISRLLLNDKEDLIHKAVGWMLRETGKRNMQIEEQFLRHYYKQMPRTMLRYAIEKFPQEKRQMYLKGEI